MVTNPDPLGIHMHRHHAILAALVLAAPAVAGCSNNEAAAADDPAVSPSPTAAITRTEAVRSLINGGGKVTVKPGTETVMYEVTVQPGSSTGWHTHPSAGFFIVTKGVLTDYGLDGPACESVRTKAGETHFVPTHPRHPHLARNETAGVVEATIFYMNVPKGQPISAPAEAPEECPDDLK